VRTPLDTALAEKNPSKESKRPKSGGIAFPFSLKRSGPKDANPGSSASTATITSAIGVSPTKDVRTAEAMSSGISNNKKAETKQPTKDEEVAAATAAAQSTGRGTDGLKQSEGEEKAVQNGQAVPADRPQLESFVTATEDLPKPNAGFAQLEVPRKSTDNKSNKSIRDYVNW